jgi:aminopeptidase N
VVSAFRNFSAPIKLFQSRTPETLGFLLAHDEDLFNRWDAAQQLATQAILNAITNEVDGQVLKILIEAFSEVARKEWKDLSYEALLLTLPSTDYIGSFLKVMDPVAIHHGRESVRKALSIALHDEWQLLYQRFHEDAFHQFDAKTIGRRRLKNVCLDYLQAKDDTLAHELALQQFNNTRTMTDRMAALSAIVNSHHPHKSSALESFYQEWQGDDLVVGKWFTVQATCKLEGTLDDVIRLTQHPAFDMNMPNHVRSLIGGFSQSNPVNFHAIDGRGYLFLEEKVLALNAINPQIAARMLAAMTGWRRYDSIRGRFMREALERIVTVGELSSDVYEVASKALVAEN